MRRLFGRAPAPRLVCTVSTVRDSADNVRSWVAGNLAAGADHMFVFVDDADAEVVAAVSGTPHVTVVPTGPGYWRGQRPTGVNGRQIVNANLVNLALCAVPEVAWLFHLDGDERLHLDKQALLAVPRDVPVVELGCWEAVSKVAWEGPVTHFKRPLSHDELCLLTLLKVIAAPDMRRYFRGHERKPGMRPDPALRLRVHHVEDASGRTVGRFTADWLRVLHYESHSGEEFVRKWTVHLDNGKLSHRDERDWLRNAVRAVVTNPALTEADRSALLLQLYRNAAEDDLETLDRLGLLVTPDPAWHEHRPSGLSPEGRERLDEVMGVLCSADKRHFKRGPDALDPAGLARQLGLGRG